MGMHSQLPFQMYLKMSPSSIMLCELFVQWILTINVQINVNKLGRMRADLALVLALVTAVDALDLKTPVIWVLELAGVPRVAGVRMLSHR